MLRILIIDDDVQIRTILRELLGDEGHEVIEASDGIEGIRLYREKSADLVMPKKDGLETIMDLKIEFPEVKIIAISGGGRFEPEPYLQLAEGFGALRLLTKPFKIEQLSKAIRKVLG